MGKCFTLLHPRRKLSLEKKVLTFSLAGLEVVSSSAFISYVLQVQVLLRSCQTNLISSCYVLPFPLLQYLAQIEPFWRQYTTRWDRVSNPGPLTYESGARVRCPTDCATRPGKKNIPGIAICMLKDQAVSIRFWKLYKDNRKKQASWRDFWKVHNAHLDAYYTCMNCLVNTDVNKHTLSDKSLIPIGWFLD